MKSYSRRLFTLRRLLQCRRGATAVEFAVLAWPVILFIFGLMQVSYVVWIDNLLQVSVNTAARCGAVNSTTPPCAGSDMVSAATTTFLPLTDGTFTANDCGSGLVGLVGTFTVTFLMFVDVTLSAQSCYPTVSS